MNLQQAKALFFAQYFGRQVLSERGVGYEGEVFTINGYAIDCANEMDKYLLLKSVNDLTDAELIVFAKHSAYRLDESNVLAIGKSMVNHMFELNNWSGNTILKLTDYLRSIEVLLPFTYINDAGEPVTLKPEEIISFGWAKYQTFN